MTTLSFPEGAFKYVEANSFFVSIVRYIINSNNERESIYLKPWLDKQVLEASKDEEVMTIVTDANATVGDPKDYDTKAINMLRWVKANITYKGDIQTRKAAEYWQTYKETLNTKTGDCEDGAILMYVLCRLSGIPANRLYIAAGDVNGGGHAFLTYKPSYDPTSFSFLDWCYWFDNRPMKARPMFRIVGKEIKESIFNKVKDFRLDNYYRIWFLFNEDNTYLRVKQTFG